MEIERLLKIAEGETDKETIVMILSNRITHCLGDKDGTAIAIGAFETVANDILAWHKSKANSQ